MSRVTLMIGGRDYAVACAEGEEAHVAGLGQIIDAKLAELPSATAQSEVRSLLFAALLLADEVSELRHALPDPAAIPEAIPEPAPDPAQAGQFNARLNAIAQRLEQLASALAGAD